MTSSTNNMPLLLSCVLKFNNLSKRIRYTTNIVFSVLLFGGMILLGYTANTREIDSTNVARELSSGLEHSFLEILINNLFVGLLAVCGGFIVIPLVILIIKNGYFVGAGTSILVTEYGWNNAFFFLIHGIFELPALVFAIAAGLRMGTLGLSYLWIVSLELFDEKYDVFLDQTKHHVISEVVVLCSISLILFIIGAFVETTFTTQFILNHS